MATPSGNEQVYATLLLSDSYLPGALVLAHSLRDAQTTRKLAVLVTDDSVSTEAITELNTVYDYVIPVPRIKNENPANLYLMNRADLHSAFTKINLWKLTEFSKIVYIDADIVAYRAPDELFDLPHAFSAAPDIGWPDLFNTGVMVLTPNMGDYHAMIAMSEHGISFDGADQGLLNMHFKDNYNRLSFTYNVTPSAHYQYVPAYKHFQSSINLVHFIGSNKPWFAGRNAAETGSPFDEMVGRWWAVYDRHYRVSGADGKSVSELVRYLTKGEFNPTSQQNGYKSWDAQRQAPPTDSQPEAMNFPNTHYEMSRDTSHFVAPNASNNSWYQVQPPKPIFPWETSISRPAPSRSFPGEPAPPPSPRPSRDTAAASVRSESRAPTERSTYAPSERSTRAPSERSYAESYTTDTRSEPSTPTTPTIKVMPSDPWTSYSRTNAWDEVPEIERYVQRHRRGKSSGSLPGVRSPLGPIKPTRENLWQQGLKLTDFPTETERPSLPVTPAPIRRPKFWGGGDPVSGDNDGGSGLPALPAAEGVPTQSDWDPAAQLQKLAEQQSELLLRKLGISEEADEPSAKPGIAQSSVLSPQPVKGEDTTSKLRNMAGLKMMIPPPSYSGPGAAWEKDEDIPLRETPMLPTEEERDILET